MIKLAEAYEREDNWHVQSASMATTGLWFGTPPLISVSRLDHPRRKGEVALEVLNASRQGVPLPADSNSVIGPLLARAGVKSWPAFKKKAKCVGLELEDNKLTLIPNRQIPRSNGSLEGIDGQEIVLPGDASPEAIGLALQEAFARCQ